MNLTPKLSLGLKLILSPLFIFPLASVNGWFNFVDAMRKAGKRGHDATLYPTDFRKVNLVLEARHEVTGKLFSIEASDNISQALEVLANWIKEEDYIIDVIDAVCL